MKFAKGDHVAFLDENQKGIIKEVLTNDKVVVEIEDGFEIEVFAKELVKQNVPFETKIKVDNPELISGSNLLHDPDELCPENTICFTAVPSSGNQVMTGEISYFISNKTSFDLIYTFYAKVKERTQGIKYGIVKSGFNDKLLAIQRDVLTDYSHFKLDALIFHPTEPPLINHIKQQIPILFPDIKSANKTAEGSIVFGKMFLLYDNRKAESDHIKDLVAKFHNKEDITKTDDKLKNRTSFYPADYGIHINEKVVDLHIEELQSNISDLTNSEMVQIQLNKFHTEMSIALNTGLKKIIFIHGVGNGVLKNVIRHELKNYKGIQFKDGDPRKFGSGATEVLF